MTRAIRSLLDIAGDYAALVLDQWGVLHDGSGPYPGVVKALERISAAGHRLAVLSNSGKRSAANAARIARMGFAPGHFSPVMTSGEALWIDVHARHVPHRRFHVIEGRQGDALCWASGLDIDVDADIETAEALLLMGLPDHAPRSAWQPVLDRALARHLTLYCSNPDLLAPRAGGQTVRSPGTLAESYKDAGGHVVCYGKPHRKVFAVLEDGLEAPPERLLMVGDSLDHDIAGAHAAGWDSLLVFGGLCRDMLAHADPHESLARVAGTRNLPMPTYTIALLK